MADNIALALLTHKEILMQREFEQLVKYSALFVASFSLLCIVVLVGLKRSKIFDWSADHQWKFGCLIMIFVGDLALYYQIKFVD